jgi:hypothetical protein
MERFCLGPGVLAFSRQLSAFKNQESGNIGNLVERVNADLPDFLS